MYVLRVISRLRYFALLLRVGGCSPAVADVESTTTLMSHNFLFTS